MKAKKTEFEVKWCTEADHGDSHWWCDVCGQLSKEAFVINKVRGDWTICYECMQLVQSSLSPLAILVQTGKDTTHESQEDKGEE